MNTLYLNLDRSRNATSFPKDESFWIRELVGIERIIRRHSRQLNTWEQQQGVARRQAARQLHEFPVTTIVILGGRGSGKSSLLRTLLRRLRRRDSPKSVEERVSSDSEAEELPLSRFAVLQELDPTLLSNQDQFLYAVLASLLEQLETHRDCDDEVFPGDLRSTHSFRNLARHLRAVDPKLQQSEQPIIQSMEQLDAHRSGPELKKGIWRFLTNFASDLDHPRTGEKKVAILPIDDPDMAFDHFYNILEQYRRYLVHPYLLPIFTFSEELARHLLVEKYIRHFDRRMEKAGKSMWTSVDELSQQYLSKLFPTRQRVPLLLPEDQLLEAVAFRDDSRPTPEDENWKERKVRKLLEWTLDQLLDEKSDELIRNLLPPSLRQSIRLIDALDHKSKVKDGKRHLRRRGEIGLPTGLVQAVADVHSGILRKYGLESEYLYALNSEQRGAELQAGLLRVSGDKVRRLISTWREGYLRRDALLISVVAAKAFQPPLLSQLESHLPDEADQQGQKVSSANALVWAMRVTREFYLKVVSAHRHLGGSPRSPRRNEDRGAQPSQARESSEAPDGTPQRAAHLGLSSQALRAGGVLHGAIQVHSGERINLGKEDSDLFPGEFVGHLARDRWKGYSVERWVSAVSDRPSRAAPEELPAVLGLGDLMDLAGPRLRLFLEIWTEFGEEGGGLWSCFSLWRAMSLVIDILAETTTDEGFLRKALEKHLQRRAVGSSTSSRDAEGQGGVMPRRPWEEFGVGSETLKDEKGKWDVEKDLFVESLNGWWKKYSKMGVAVGEVLRMVRGDYVVGLLFRELEERRAGTAEHRWGPGIAMRTWLESLCFYLRQVSEDSSQGPAETTGGTKPRSEQGSKEEGAPDTMTKVVAECPVFFPLFKENQKRCSLLYPKAPQKADSKKADSVSENLDLRILRERGAESIPFVHDLTLTEVLDAVVPAPYEGYFRNFQERVRTRKLKIQEAI